MSDESREKIIELARDAKITGKTSIKYDTDLQDILNDQGLEYDDMCYMYFLTLLDLSPDSFYSEFKNELDTEFVDDSNSLDDNA